MARSVRNLEKFKFGAATTKPTAMTPREQSNTPRVLFVVDSTLSSIRDILDVYDCTRLELITRAMPFFNLLYGNQSSKLFNSDCQTNVLLDTIKKQCEISEENIDIADKFGTVLKLSNQLTESAAAKFEARGNYVLVVVKKKGLL